MEAAHRTLEVENSKLQAKLDAAEKATERANLDMRRIQSDAAIARTQQDELVASLRRSEASTKEENAKLRSELDQARTEVRRTIEQSEQYALEVRKRLNDLEIDRDNHHAKAVSLKKSVETKDSELVKESREKIQVRDNLERVVRELADRCKQLEEDGKRKASQHERDIEEVIREHQRCTTELMDARKQVAGLSEDNRLYESQIANVKRVNADLVDELDGAKRRCRALEEESDDAKASADRAERHVDELRAECDDLTEKLSKADAHIQRITQQAEEAHLDNIKAKHELELLDDDVAAARRERDDLVTRLTPFMSAVAEDTDRLTQQLDKLLMGISTLAAMNSGTSAPSRGSEAAARAFSCWPTQAEADSGSSRSSAESTVIVCAMRLRDALALIVEDVRMVERGLEEETHRKSDALRKDAVIEETLQAERSHVLELAAKLGEAEQKFDECEAQRNALEKALADSSQWMSEAVALQEERTRRVEALVADKEALQSSVASLEHKIADQQTALRAARDEAEREHDAVRKASADLKATQRTVQALEEELASAKRSTTAARNETTEREADVHRLKATLTERDEAVHRADAEARYSKRQLEDVQNKLRMRDENVAALEAREQQLKDQLHGATRRLDAALRSGGAHPISANSPAAATATTAAPTATTPSSLSRLTLGASPQQQTSRRTDSPVQQRSATTPTTSTRHVSPSRHADPARSYAAVRAEYRSPPRAPAAATATSTPNAAKASNSSAAMGTPRAGNSSDDAGATDRLRAWESRINSLLSSSRGAN